jgi:hypothetical protein
LDVLKLPSSLETIVTFRRICQSAVVSFIDLHILSPLHLQGQRNIKLSHYFQQHHHHNFPFLPTPTQKAPYAPAPDRTRTAQNGGRRLQLTSAHLAHADVKRQTKHAWVLLHNCSRPLYHIEARSPRYPYMNITSLGSMSHVEGLWEGRAPCSLGEGS